MNSDRTIDRRTFIKAGTIQAAVGCYALSRTARATASSQESDPYGGLKMGAQSYSFRKFSWEDAVTQLKKLGLVHMEFYPGHIPLKLSPEERASVLAKLRAAAVTFPCYGVVGFGADAARNRKTFEFAKSMGIDTITADPSQESLKSLDSLVEEFEIRIAIHNHGPGARYATIEDVLSAIEGHHKLIGACVDTGHFVRANVDAVEATERLAGRLYGVHLKDVYPDGKDAIFGKGAVNFGGVVKLLRGMKFDSLVAIEFESHPDNPVPPIQECLDYLKEVIASI